MLRSLVLILFFPFYAHAFVSADQLTVEEKVGQLLMVNFIGETVNEDAKYLIQDLSIGSVIYYNWANSLHSPEQVLNLSNGLQALAGQNRCAIPLIIAVDQEGGIVNRLQNGFTAFPGNMALGMTKKPELAYLSALYTGQELKAVGISMNLAPVVDVNTNPKNPIIGIRSYGNSTEIVIPFARNALKGFHEAGIITALKHFPGHGDVEIDSHENLPVLRKTKKELDQVELLPFKELASQTDVVVTAHLLATALDEEHCATLSKKTLDLLREELGFDGVICSDSLIMEGLVKSCSSIEEAVLHSFEAGCDLLMLGGRLFNGKDTKKELTVTDIKKIHAFLVHTIRSGRITTERLDRSVNRILNLKQRYISKSEKPSQINLPQHHALAKEISAQAIKIISNNELPAFNQSKIAFFAPDFVQDSVKKTGFLTLALENHHLFFSNPTELEQQKALKLADDADILIFCSCNAWKNAAQANLIKMLQQKNKPMILIVLQDSLDAYLFQNAAKIIITFSPVDFSIEAVYGRI